MVGRVSPGAAHMLSSQRYFFTVNGIREATEILGFDTTSDFVRAYPLSRVWLTLLIRLMEAVASFYRIVLHDGRNFSAVR